MILLTGNAGYVGSVLQPKLKDYDVKTVDLCWFGGEADFKMNFWEVPLDGIDTIIHLAGIPNDATGALDPKVTWETNVLGTALLAQRAAKKGVKQFIYASSGSVYGISQLDDLDEDESLVPISEYNKSKMVAERILLSYKDQMNIQIVRPATVCGWSPRMRLDVMVNSFVIQALEYGEIKFNGGEQYRPNIHIQDMTDLYVWLLENPHEGIFNAGFENLKIEDIAKKVQNRIPCKIIPRESNDPRSYRISSNKLLQMGFKPKKIIADAIAELVVKYHNHELRDTDECYRLKTMKLFH